MSRTHSRFAPSSLERVLACPRSVALAEALGVEGRGSVYAAEGSVAHMVAEAYLRQQAWPALNVKMLPVGEIVVYEGYEITVTQEMHDHGRDYAAYVLGLMQPDSVLFIETTVRLDAIVGEEADMYGHLDAAVWTPSTGTLDVVDYKYGAGVKVSPLDNPQLKAYALGAMFSLPDVRADDVQLVKTHVFQPRIPPALPPDTIPAIDILLWGQLDLAPVVSLILKDGAIEQDYVTGDHCRWCPALAHCPAMRERATRAAQKAFADPPVPPSALTTSELAVVLDEVDVCEPWFEAARAEGLRRAMAADVPRGRKLVQGKSRREWLGDANTTVQRLRKFKISKAALYDPPKLKSVAQVEKIVKAKHRGDWLEIFTTFYERKPGGFTLAKSTDPRPEAHAASAEDVFARVPLPADLTDPN